MLCKLYMTATVLCLSYVIMHSSDDIMLTKGNKSFSEDMQVETVTIKKSGVIVKVTGIDRAYGEAFASILSEARNNYEEVFGLPMPDTVILEVKKEVRGLGRPELYTDGKSTIFLVIESEQHLATPFNKGPYNIYGMCHELGHIAMYHKMGNTIGLHEAVAEGWAHYAGSVIEDTVARLLGDNIWPEPYDVIGTECIARLKKQVEGKNLTELNPTFAGAKMFYELEKKHGRKTVGLALANALSQSPSGEELMPLFLRSLRIITGDSTVGDWIPEDFVNPSVEWRVKERLVDDSFFDDMTVLTDSTGIMLYYDDGTYEGRRSIAGMGHAILFQKPKGSWFLDKIYVFGSRYGEQEPPVEDFSVYICDKNFHVVHELRYAYSLFDYAQEKWHTLRVDSLGLPQRFYICLFFNPTSTKGVYVYFDENVSHPHSYIGLPDTDITDVEEKYDWMIRAHFCKLPEE